MEKRIFAALALILAAAPIMALPAKKAAKPKPKAKVVKPAPAPNKGAGAIQIKALEGPLLTTTFNNGGCQIRFSNLRQSLAWEDDGAGEGRHYILVDLDIANVTKGNINADIHARSADDAGRQMDEDAAFWKSDMLPASHANGTLAFRVDDDFTPTKLILQFGYDLGDPIRAFLPKDYAWNKFINVGPAGTAVDNGLVSITAQIEDNPKLPKDWEASEGYKYIVVSGRVTSLFSKPHEIALDTLKLNSKDGQTFDPYGFIVGQIGEVNPKGSRPFRVGFQVTEDVEPDDMTIILGFCNPAPIKVTF